MDASFLVLKLRLHKRRDPARGRIQVGEHSPAEHRHSRHHRQQHRRRPAFLLLLAADPRRWDQTRRPPILPNSRLRNHAHPPPTRRSSQHTTLPHKARPPYPHHLPSARAWSRQPAQVPTTTRSGRARDALPGPAQTTPLLLSYAPRVEDTGALPPRVRPAAAGMPVRGRRCPPVSLGVETAPARPRVGGAGPVVSGFPVARRQRCWCWPAWWCCRCCCGCGPSLLCLLGPILGNARQDETRRGHLGRPRRVPGLDRRHHRRDPQDVRQADRLGGAAGRAAERPPVQLLPAPAPDGTPSCRGSCRTTPAW